jgi:hypothetical protein
MLLALLILAAPCALGAGYLASVIRSHVRRLRQARRRRKNRPPRSFCHSSLFTLLPAQPYLWPVKSSSETPQQRPGRDMIPLAPKPTLMQLGAPGAYAIGTGPTALRRVQDAGRVAFLRERRGLLGPTPALWTRFSPSTGGTVSLSRN